MRNINRTSMVFRSNAARHDLTVSNDEGTATVDLAAMPVKRRQAAIKATTDRWKQERAALYHANKEADNG
jgi:hypothetical protein